LLAESRLRQQYAMSMKYPPLQEIRNQYVTKLAEAADIFALSSIGVKCVSAPE